jgi:geranylgeranyl diphosphate synthase type II
MDQNLVSCFESSWQAWVENFYQDRPHHPDALTKACRYALLSPGKRVRPYLVLHAYQLMQKDYQKALPAAFAIECVHTYSLVHDDLPSMDNDDLRRGRPTTHKIFGEAMGILVGDALLTDAFSVLATASLPAPTKVVLLQELAHAAGSRGMVQGQALDIHWTGKKAYTQAAIAQIHSLKTARLIEAACVMGALCAGMGEEAVAQVRTLGQDAGLLFQFIDDMLDNSSATGKSQGKDIEQEKATYLALNDPELVQCLHADLVSRVTKGLEPWHNSSLAAFIMNLTERQF